MLPMPNVFEAVADSTRRTILQQLRLNGPLSVSEIASPLPITRQAVTKHLNALSSAGLITTEWRGRERRHHLEARPLKDLADWLEPYEQAWDLRLERLKDHLEKKP